MKLGNTSIPGLYKFKPLITFEKDDILYYKGMLYVVTAGVYNGELNPEESPKCDSFVDILKDTEELVTTSNIMTIVNNILKGVQLGGTITNLRINNISQLDEYIYTGIYSLSSNHVLQNKAFDSILKVYQFTLRTSVAPFYATKVVQEIVNYAPVNSNGQYLPTNIWYRIGTLVNDKVPDWVPFKPIVSAANNTEYGNALNELAEYNEKVTTDALKLSNLLSNGTYYYLSLSNNHYELPTDHSGLINVIYKYQESNNWIQDNFTIDISNNSETEYSVTAYSVGGRLITANVSIDNNMYLITFSYNNQPLNNILKVIEITI